MTLILSQWRAEWLKLLGRKRTYIGFGAFILLEAVILMVFQFEAPEKFYRLLIVQQGGAFEEYFSALTLGFIVQAISVGLLGSIYLALVSGDIVAKESEDGTCRNNCFDVSRTGRSGGCRTILEKNFCFLL